MPPGYPMLLPDGGGMPRGRLDVKKREMWPGWLGRARFWHIPAKAEATIMSERHWSGYELLDELSRFEGELRAAGLRDHAVEEYVGRSRAFVRWLRGERTAGEQDGADNEASQRTGRTLGLTILDDLRTEMDRDRIIRYLTDYGAVSGYDAAFRRLLAVTCHHLDLQSQTHRAAVIDWLRAWGCRHLRRTDTDRTSQALELWWEAWGEKLPGPETALTGLGEPGLLVIEHAFDALRTVPAAGRNLKGREIDVVFGDTAAAKVMFVARPNVFLPWDEPIRLAFGWWGGGAAYAELLRLSAAALDGLARRLGTSVTKLPEVLRRPGSSAPKLVDEFLWIRITKGL